ncbi:glycoside hydrolase family 5 protein [Nocardioides ferulae]|uniref:glycoside hydrolase family 5 protein n=1 Tax=Nocardioides ferulae TaxID=2340821 RepID=UPI000EB2E717|nr:cellulase family glycosylhydrolase [Nocardioides ferulae]
MRLRGRDRLGRATAGREGTADDASRPPADRAPAAQRRHRAWHWLLAGGLVLCAGAAVGFVTLGPDDAAGESPAGAAHVRVEGNRLVDARSGRGFVPRGVNWSSFEYACAQGWGYSALDTVAAADPFAHEAEAMAAWNVNTVRLPLNQDCWLGTRGAPVSDEYHERTVEGYREQVTRFVRALNDAGAVVVLDLHSRKRAETPEFGNLAMPDAESLAFWRSLAGTFADNPSVMFDAFNEPYSRYGPTGEQVFDLTWSCWRDGGCNPPVEDDRTATLGRVTYRAEGMTAVVAAIRGAGAEQPVLLAGLDYANDLAHWREFAPADDQLVASFHSYDFKDCGDRACWDEVLAPLAGAVPLLTGELGATDPLEGYVEDYLRWAGEQGVGVLFWVWADHGHDPMSLLTPDGEPTAYGALVRSWLGDA